jgi:large subunit ribosomal protein L30
MATRKGRKKQAKVEALVRRMRPAAAIGGARLRVTLAGSEIGGTDRQRATLRCLGLRKRGSQSEVSDTPQTRGRIRAVAHLVRVEEGA